MEVARHVFDTYFEDTPNPLVRHHLDSYADMLNSKIPNFIKGSNPLQLTLVDDRSIKVYIGGKNGDKIAYLPPVDDDNKAVLPHACRLDNTSYTLDIRGTVDIEYTVGKQVETRSFENVRLAKIPLMLKSSLCYLSTMNGEQLYDAGECRFELGGYFVIGGAEKVLLTQERLGDNMVYASKRSVKPDEAESRGLVEKEVAIKIEGATKAEKFEYIGAMRSVSEDGTRGPYSHFIVIPPKNDKPDDPDKISKVDDWASFSTKRLVLVTLPGFTQPVPLVSVFHALGLTNDQDIYDTILTGIPDSSRSMYDELFAEMIISHNNYLSAEMRKETDQTQDPNLLVLRRQHRTRTNGGVYMNLYSEMFPHCGRKEGETAPALYRRKAYILGSMARMAMDVAIGVKQKSDRDHYRYKRMDASGDLIFYEFRRIYKEVAKRMITELDVRIHFQQKEFSGMNIKELVSVENIDAYYWSHKSFIFALEKSFKGKWGGMDGVSQELTRLGYLGTVAHLRRVNLQMDKGLKIVEPRRIHGSSWGLLCPIDNPDGGGIGMTKSLTFLCTISTASPSSDILNIISKFGTFIPIVTIHPSTWNPGWTKVFINADLVGVFNGKTETYHSDLIERRRKREISKFVCLSWNRVGNEYVIFTDAGRPMRPIYREGVRGDTVKKIKSWDDMDKTIIDYIDAQETDNLRISMEPFSPNLHSEIHGSTILSALSSISPNADHNPATRNAFTCQQAKQTSSWFNTAFDKRFDTIATLLNTVQRPLSQTWTHRHVMGRDGCIGYGLNCMVALAVYGGYNQEDSILMNEGSLKRGMFQTSYYHSYDITEEAIMSGMDKGAMTVFESTLFANVATDPRYRETVVRKEGYNYDLLDADGIIMQGKEIDDKTILVGLVTPTKENGQVTGYRDKSSVPKRGQHGIVDAVYRYVTREGLHGVKIRIAENRVPVLGDKFAARHGQKGTCGLRVPEEDMPYTAEGLRPDLIVNPHAFPSRMTVGQFIESLSTKLGIHLGSLVDSTAFSSQNRIGEVRDILSKSGFHPYGHEILYNGQTGEMMETEIFMAPTYYLRIKQMVEDKINYRTTGPRKLLTKQPVEGRSNDGGLRIGEMERDGLISHGVSKFLNESLMDRSDKSEVLFQPETGYLDSSSELQGKVLTTPYALGLIIRELESMHISVKLAAP